MITTDDLNVMEGGIARYKDKRLLFCFNKPTKNSFRGDGLGCECIELPEEMFPNLKFEDGPIKVELTIKTIKQ